MFFQKDTASPQGESVKRLTVLWSVHVSELFQFDTGSARVPAEKSHALVYVGKSCRFHEFESLPQRAVSSKR